MKSLIMVVKDETLIFVRDKVSGSNPECKVIVAPTMVGVYLNKSKDVILRAALSHHWKFQQRGLLALVYHPLLNRLKLMLVDEKCGRVHWQETFGDYTNYECIHDVFHILNSSKNFCQKIGLFYADEKVAKMVNNTLEVFAAQTRRELSRRDRNGKLVARSKSFNSSERVRIEVKLKRSYSNSMGDIKIHHTGLRLFEAEARKYAGKQQPSRRSSLRRMLNGLRSSFRARGRRQDGVETRNEGSKRKRLSSGSSGSDEKLTFCECSQGCESNSVVKDDNTECLHEIANELDSLSENWKLTELELQQIYRLSFMKERKVQSTDLCVTDL